MVAESAAVRRLDRGTRLSTVADDGYRAADRARWVTEDPKRDQLGDFVRGQFQRDRARVLHSHAFRRLADKTQVVSPGLDDFPRTRLTHSLEVAQIAREMGAALGCDPDVTDTAGLAHDLGHPPFGHNGEQALNEAAAQIGGFEGNAQTLRILTRLEAKVLAPDGSPAGLNLTRASLDAVCKYPWPSSSSRGLKFGVYADDRAAFDWLRDGRPDGQRCLEAQVMDWADDVAYSVHDLEDGVHSGHITLRGIDDDDRHELCELAAKHYLRTAPEELEPVLDALLALPALADLAAFDGSYHGQAAAKRATSELTGRFAGAAVHATRARFGDRPLTRYAADLQIPNRLVAECALLKAIALRYVMHRPGVEPALQEQRKMLVDLVTALSEQDDTALTPLLRPAWRQAGTEQERLRVVIDQVAQLTDSAAQAWHRRIVVGNRT